MGKLELSSDISKLYPNLEVFGDVDNPKFICGKDKDACIPAFYPFRKFEVDPIEPNVVVYFRVEVATFPGCAYCPRSKQVSENKIKLD
jgi:hypothetical protein